VKFLVLNLFRMEEIGILVERKAQRLTPFGLILILELIHLNSSPLLADPLPAKGMHLWSKHQQTLSGILKMLLQTKSANQSGSRADRNT